jgi:DNA-binding response OmpR family regulator
MTAGPGETHSGAVDTNVEIVMGKKSQILIIDDEPNLRLVFLTALESAGYDVAEASSGEKGLERLRRFPADLVLLDLLMPGLGGIEVLERMRNAGISTPVVIITAHGSVPDAVLAMKLGALDFLSKPIQPGSLRAVASDVLRRHDAIGSGRPSNPGAAARRAATADQEAVGGRGVDRAKRALYQREFLRANDLLEEVLEREPDSAEAHHLMGVLRESLGQDRAAYEAYRTALEVDPHYLPALDRMRRYCVRCGLDFSNWSINPGAE